jgi:hypothetical protein
VCLKSGGLPNRYTHLPKLQGVCYSAGFGVVSGVLESLSTLLSQFSIGCWDWGVCPIDNSRQGTAERILLRGGSGQGRAAPQRSASDEDRAKRGLYTYAPIRLGGWGPGGEDWNRRASRRRARGFQAPVITGCRLQPLLHTDGSCPLLVPACH